jgi:hypothetical protein
MNENTEPTPLPDGAAPILGAQLETLKEIAADTEVAKAAANPLPAGPEAGAPVEDKVLPQNPVSSTPQPVPATTTKEQPKFPPHIPQFKPQKHPLLFAIHGRKHMVGPLKDLITADANLPEPYKALLHHELSFVETNAAEIHLHVVKHANGDVSFQGHVKRIQLG